MEAQGLTAEEGLVSENRPVMADALELAESPAPTAMCTRVSAEEDRDAELPAASTPSSASPPALRAPCKHTPPRASSSAAAAAAAGPCCDSDRWLRSKAVCCTPQLGRACGLVDLSQDAYRHM